MKKLLSVIATLALSLGSLVAVSTAAAALPATYAVTSTAATVSEGESTTIATDAPDDAVVTVFVDGVSTETLTAGALDGAVYSWGWGVTDTSVAHTVSFRVYEPGTGEVTSETAAAGSVDVEFQAKVPEASREAPLQMQALEVPANETNWNRMCGYWQSESNSSYADFTTPTVDFTYVCLTDGSISDAETANRSDAYDGFGQVVTSDVGSGTDSRYIFTADTEPVVTDSSVSFVDEDVWSSTEGAYVDVTVERQFSNNWATWDVTVVLADSSIPARIDLSIEGNLGSDGRTRITELGNNGVLTDDGDSFYDPALLWVSEGEFVGSNGSDPIRFNYGTVSSASLINGLVDYEYCTDRATIDAAVVEVFASLNTTYGTALETVQGECGFTFAPDSFAYSVGEEVDETFGLTFTGFEFVEGYYGWNAENLPEGLDIEVVEDDLGNPVGVRLFGTPTATYGSAVSITFSGYSFSEVDYYSSYVVATEQLTGTVDTLVELAQDLQANIGDIIAGTGVEYSAVGLLPDSNWSQTVRSTPQILASGVVGNTGTISGVGMIPSGLEAGWHTLTLEGVNYLNQEVQNVVWFELDSNGVLLSIRSSAPVAPVTPVAPSTPAATGLAQTGASDAGMGATTLGLFALLGLGAAVFAAGRLRRVAK
ncbi:hypothetical protein ACR5KS_07230 [Leucobacter sp. W1153]|uniref:hypothetical protein n=1 Tax=Leucobacter sp. W1153 TaxID=3439064 RepID=UPI003F2AB271